ncbi:MAG TPA: hypothetical protein VJ326_05635 [Thermoplasmata archaeon]|nr:hypothetical protein [Thermoplasmata archaeon]
MAFRLERDLYGPVAAWLADAGFVVSGEIRVAGRRADLVGWREDGVAAVETKLADWRGALRQAIAYQVAADWSWVAMPLPGAARAHRDRWRFDAEGVGLLAVDASGHVRTVLPAADSRRLLPFARDGVRPVETLVSRKGLPLSTRETSLEPF